MKKRVMDLLPGDVFDIVPVVLELGLAVNPPYVHGRLVVVDKVWQEYVGTVNILARDGVRFELPENTIVDLLHKESSGD